MILSQIYANPNPAKENRLNYASKLYLFNNKEKLYWLKLPKGGKLYGGNNVLSVMKHLLNDFFMYLLKIKNVNAYSIVPSFYALFSWYIKKNINILEWKS